MSGLLGRILGIPKATTFAGFQVQTSVYGAPIPIIYGTTRVAGNLIHMPSQPVASGGGGGKLSNSKGAQSGQNFIGPLIIALCEGPIDSILFVWRDKDAAVDFTVAYVPDGWDGSHLGTDSQTPWSYLSTNFPAEAVPYQSTAYLANAAASFPNDSMSQYSWQVVGFFPFDVGSVIYDASPADIIPDFLTNAQYGVGMPSGEIGDLTALEDYCAAAGLFISPAVDTQKPAADWVNEFIEAANTALVWSDGLLKFIPYGDTALTGHGHTYTPNTTPLYDLTDADFLAPHGTDPIVVTRKSPADVPNSVQVVYRDWEHAYNQTTYTAFDQLAIETYGVIPLPPLTMPAITTRVVAQQIAQLRLQREQNVRNTYSFKLGWRYSLLEPMDLVTLTDAGLGLSLTPVRITAVTDPGDESGFDIEAEDWPFGTASATLYTTQAASGSSTNANVDPGDTITPLIFEGPPALASSALDIWIGASGGASWGGCDVYISVDDAVFSKVGTIRGKAIYGTLTATLATDSPYPAIDTTHTLSVDVSPSGGALDAQSQESFDGLVPLCYVGGAEFVDYRDLTLTGAFQYDLSHLYRGLYNSPVGSHLSGADFIFCDSNILRVPWPIGFTGQVLYFKFVSFNIYGAGLQDIAGLTSVAHTVGQDPVIIGNSVPQGTIVIDTAGNWVATIDGPAWAASIRYASSTVGFPSDATVLASGTNQDGRVITVTSGSPLAPGETIYLSAIPFSAITSSGLAGPSARFQATYPGGGGAAPSITFIQAYNAFYPNDGGGSFDVSWVTANMPGGVTYNIDYTITAGNYTPPNTGSQSGIASGDTISHPFASIPSGDIVITAILSGVVIATGAFSGGFT